jgi:2-dehydro-3-deoxygluconokinase
MARYLLREMQAEGIDCSRVLSFPDQCTGFLFKGWVDDGSDALAVGMISALPEDCGVADAVRRAAWIGARAVQVLGETEGLPTREQLVAASL